MRLCSRWDLAIHARLVIHDDETPMVRIRAGGMTYLLEPSEARRLVRELIDALDGVDAVVLVDRGRQP
jgi:hypothetical protein